jgi:hypothetical protein
MLLMKAQDYKRRMILLVAINIASIFSTIAGHGVIEATPP